MSELLHQLAELAGRLHSEQTAKSLQKLLRTAQRAGDRALLVATLQALTMSAALRGDSFAERRYGRRLWDARPNALSAVCLGMALEHGGERRAARTMFERGLQLAEAESNAELEESARAALARCGRDLGPSRTERPEREPARDLAEAVSAAMNALHLIGSPNSDAGSRVTLEGALRDLRRKLFCFEAARATDAVGIDGTVDSLLPLIADLESLLATREKPEKEELAELARRLASLGLMRR